MIVIEPGPRRGAVKAPPSKSHAHRLLLANFLSGRQPDGRMSATAIPDDDVADSQDILATKRCLRALVGNAEAPELDCGESGSTLRFLAPVAAALGKSPAFRMSGRLAERPFKPYSQLNSGVHEMAGDVSSQFVTGLLFALPLLQGDSTIRFTSPLESRGYVDMTLKVLGAARIAVSEVSDGYAVSGGQTYHPQPMSVEGDWSGAAFWIAMNALGSDIRVTGLDKNSAQPDRAIGEMLERIYSSSGPIDVSQCPDIFPVLAVAAAAHGGTTRFVGIGRLRLKECDRVAAMAETVSRLGRDVRVEDGSIEIVGRRDPFAGGSYRSFGDHRIAMSVAVAATHAEGAVSLDDAECAAKSYPTFFDDFARLDRIHYTGGKFKEGEQ